MKKRILSILLLCSMVLTMLPTAAFAADEEAYALPPDTGGLCEHHPEHDEACGYTPQTEDTAGAPCGHVCEICESGDGGADPADSTGTSGAAMPRTLTGAARPAATQFTYTLHYDANGGSGAPPSQSETSSELSIWIPISEKIPTRDGYTFKGWAESPNEKPKYLREEGYYWNYLMVHPSLNETIYAIWEVHNHNWGEWTSNGNGTHTRTCKTDSSHTETGNCSGGKATSTEKAICETCHTAYGELLQLTKTVITTPPTLPAEGYVGNEYIDEALSGGEAKAEGTGVVVPGTFRFKHNGGGRVVRPGENRMEVLFTPDDTEAYTTAECIVTVTGIKRTITRVPEDVVITDKPLGTPFEDLGLPLSPYGVMVETNTGASFSPIPVTWDGSNYNPNIYGEQIITGELHVEQSRYTDKLEPTSTVKATARITLIDDRIFTPTLEPPTYSKQLYGGDLCFLVFSDKYLSGGTATANGETVSGKFTLDKDQKIYGHSLMASTLLQAGQLQLKVIFTPDNPKRYTSAECTIDVNVIPRTFKEATAEYITNKKFGTPFEELSLSDSFSFYAVGDENDPNGTGSNYDMPVVTSWDASTYDPNSFEEQTIYGTVDRAELEKYFTIPESADLRAVRKIQLEPDPVETEITQLPVFQWKNGDFTLPDNTIFTWRKLQVGTYNDEVGTLVGGVAKVKGTDTIAPGTFSFKKVPPFYLQTPGEHDVTVVFTPDDPRLHKPTETTIKINAIKNTIRDTDEPDPITNKPLGTPFVQLGLPEKVCINAVDDAWRWIGVAWDESSYDAQSSDWQTITGTLLLDEDDDSIFQQPEPAVTAKIRVKLIAPPTITIQTLPSGTVGVAYSWRLTAQGTTPITWNMIGGALPDGLTLNETTGKISGTPTAAGTASFTVKAENSVGSDTKELSITITKDAPTEHTITVTSGGNGTASASPAKAVAGAEITLTATPDKGYHFKEWQVMSGGVTIKDNKFTMPNDNVEVQAIFEEDAPPVPTDPAKPNISVTGTYTYNGSEHTATVNGYDSTTMNVTGNTGTDAGDYTVRVTSKTGRWADGSTEAVTAAWSIGKATQEAPNGLVGVAPTTEGGSDGKITGVTEKMEYRMKAEGSYTPCSGAEIENLSAGDYFVRYAEDHNHFASSDAAVTVGAGVPLADCTITFDAGGGSGSMDSVTVKAGTIYILPACGFTAPADQEFKAWEIGGTEYKVGDSYTVNGDTEIKALWENSVITPTTYTVTVSNNGNGTGTATPSTAAAGTEITLTAAPDEGYHFKEWQVISGGVTIKDNKFTMPDSEVEVKAIFEEDAPAPTEFIVTFDGNGGTPSVGSMTTTNQRLSSLPSASQSGSYSFDGWYTEKSGGTKITNDTVFHANTTVYAHWTYTGGDGSGYSYYTIKATAGTGGSISPSGNVSVREGRDQTFTITPDKGYAVANVKIDGKSIGAVKSYTFENVRRTHTIEVIFMKAGGNPQTGVFVDVATGSYYEDAVDWAAENGITKGIDDTHFSPDGICTRAQAVTFLWRAAGSPKPETRTMPFADVPAGSYYYDAVLWAAENGITKGTSNTTFSPNTTCSRAQIVTFLWRSEKSPAAGTANPFADVKSTAYYADAVLWAVKENITEGTTSTTFSPDADCTRAQIVTFLWRCKK